MVELTDKHIDTHTDTILETFFIDPPEEIFDHNTFNTKALKPLFFYDFELEPGTSVALGSKS